MSTTYYLVIDGIPGDEIDPTKLLTGAFQIGAGFTLPTADNGSLAHGASPTTFGPLSLTLNTGSVAGLLAASASGQIIKDASVVGVSIVNGKQTITSSLNLANVTVNKVTDGPGAVSLSLDYNKIGLVTQNVDTKGTLQPPQSFGWDVLRNTSTGSGKSLTNAGSASVAPSKPVTYYLLIDGMNGAVDDKAHAGWFKLAGFNIDLANSVNPQQAGSGAGAGKAVFDNLTVNTTSETGLAALLQQEANGKALAGVRIEGVDASGQAVYDLNLASVLVTQVEDPSAPGFQLGFDYKEISLVTHGQNSTGALVQTGSFGWDRTTNRPIDPATMPSIHAGTSHGAVAPTSYYLVVNGIAGDTIGSDKLLTGAFKVNSFSLPTTDLASITQGGAGKAEFDPLNLSLDSKSVTGFLADEASGKLISDASLVGIATIDGKQTITYSLNLGNVSVAQLTTSDQTFALALDYRQIGLVTRGVSATGALQTAESFGWDVAKNTSAGSGTSLTNPGAATVAPTVPTTYYLLIDGMNGGVADKAHAGWFNLANFSTLVSNTASLQPGGGAGRATFGNIAITTTNQSALTALLQQEADGKALTGVRIEGVNANGQAVYDLNLAGVRVNGLEDPAGGGVGISVSYDEISLVTRGQSNTGALVQTGSFGWNVLENKAIDPTTLPTISAGASHGVVAPTSYYLVVNGIAGDSGAGKLLTGAFKVDSFDLPTHNTSGKTSFGGLTLSLNGESLAGFLAATARGAHIKDASLVGISTVDGKQQEITYSLNLTDVILGNVSNNDQNFGLTLNFEQIGLVTRGVSASGALQTAQSFGWDILKNTSVGPGTSLVNAGSPTVAPTVPTTYYLLIDGINGGVTAKGHAGWFGLSTFGFSLANTTTLQAGGGAGKDIFGNLSVTTPGDTGLTALLQREAEDKTLRGIRIEGVDASGHAVYDLNLADVLVKSVTDGGSGFQASFDYNKISLVTQGQTPFGNLVQTGSFGWDIPTGQAIDPASMPNISPCYCPGTLILTERGEVPVETLAIGDTVVTMSGAARPIKWIGRRGYSGRFALGQKHILPVCIKAGAIEENVPRRDLWISPHHAMYLEGVLIEAIDLVNGATVTQATEVDTVEYFHIELETHDIIIAEGSLSESFVDDDSRGMFHNAHEFAALYPEDIGAAPRYCAPRCDTGYQVEAARRHLALRAGLAAAGGEAKLGLLRGYVDVIGRGAVTGWAQNIDHPEAPVCLDIYADGRLIGQTLANRYRGDLKEAGLGSGCHGFEFAPPRGLKLTADAIDVRRSLDGVALARLYTDREGRVWVIEPSDLAGRSRTRRDREKRIQRR